MEKGKLYLIRINLVLIFLLLAGCSPAAESQFKPTIHVTTPHNERLSGLVATATDQNIKRSINPFSLTPSLMTSSISGKLVFSVALSTDPWNEQIFTKNLDTGEVQQLTHTGNNDSPIWSPDGTEILYLSWVDKDTPNLFLMEADGSNQRPVLLSSDSQSNPDWAPDGKKISFVSDRDGQLNIYIIDLATKKTTQLTNKPDGNFTPRWSSDGSKIAFVASPEGSANRTQVFAMDADGSNVTQLTDHSVHNFDENPVWCPEDACIIFGRFIGGSQKLMFLDLTTHAVTQLLKDVQFLKPERQEVKLNRSPVRGFFTFISNGDYYVMDLTTMQFYLLDLPDRVLSLSLYP
jgi:dipeptidyl aminopeptidase/acylaminoacyl peptidase